MFRVIKKIRSWWYERTRNMDVLVLWPELCKLCDDPNHARQVFMIHVMQDPAWQDLGYDEIVRRVEALTTPENSVWHR